MLDGFSIIGQIDEWIKQCFKTYLMNSISRVLSLVDRKQKGSHLERWIVPETSLDGLHILCEVQFLKANLLQLL